MFMLSFWPWDLDLKTKIKCSGSPKLLKFRYSSSCLSNEPLHAGRNCPALDAACEGFGGVAACPSPQRGSECCRRIQLRFLSHPQPPLPVGPWTPRSSGQMEPGNHWEGGGWFEASPPTPAGGWGKDVEQKERMGGEGPGLEDGGSHSTGWMQGGIWDMQRGVHTHKHMYWHRHRKHEPNVTKKWQKIYKIYKYIIFVGFSWASSKMSFILDALYSY